MGVRKVVSSSGPSKALHLWTIEAWVGYSDVEVVIGLLLSSSGGSLHYIRGSKAPMSSH